MSRILLANPRGYCAGVERAIETVERALRDHGPPIYVRHEIVHNARVVDGLRARGVVFVDEVDGIPEGAVAIFSAHGVSDAVEDAARARGLRVIDATCPLVTKVHKEAVRYRREGREVVLVGHRGHPEVEGTMGRVRDGIHLVETEADVARLEPADPRRMAYVTQTTLSVDDTRAIIDALRKRFPSILGPDVRDICYATRNRQQAARALAAEADVLIVVGGAASSNSARLREIGVKEGIPSHRVEDASEIEAAWLAGARAVGITSGASTPEELVAEAVARVREITGGTAEVETLEGPREKVRFRLPEPAGA